MKTMVLFLLVLCCFITASEQDKKLKIAILNLKNTNGVSEGESELISDRLRNEFFSTGMVDVMERDQMQEVLKEQGFQQSGVTCTDEGCMVEIGRMLGVQRLVTGSIGKLGSMFMVNVRSVNVETGKFEKVVSEDVKGDIEDVVEIIPVIARRIAGTEDIPVKRVAVIIQQESKPQEEPEPVNNDELPCNGSYYMQRLELRSNQIGFALDKDEKEELEETLAEVIGEALKVNVIPAEASQLSRSNCSTRVIRIVLNSYRKRPAAFSQFEGTANISLSIYQAPSAATPLVTVNIERTGDRHWGDETPFMNAFEEITEALEDDLRSKVKKFLK